MDLRARDVDVAGQRGDEIGIELIFAALLGDIGPRAAHHPQKSLYIGSHFRPPPGQLLLQKAAFELPVPDDGVDQGQQQRGLQFCRQGDAWSRSELPRMP